MKWLFDLLEIQGVDAFVQSSRVCPFSFPDSIKYSQPIVMSTSPEEHQMPFSKVDFHSSWLNVCQSQASTITSFFEMISDPETTRNLHFLDVITNRFNQRLEVEMEGGRLKRQKEDILP
jgi:hypothetical protein